jgi:hypothetical protein
MMVSTVNNEGEDVQKVRLFEERPFSEMMQTSGALGVIIARFLVQIGASAEKPAGQQKYFSA